MADQSERSENTWLKVQVPTSLHRDLRALAVQEDRSLKAQVNKILREYLAWTKEQQAG